MRNPCLTLLFLFAAHAVSLAQSTFSVSDTLLRIKKNNTFVFTYAPVDVYNETGDSLKIGWEFIEREGFPKGWNYALQDPENYYRDSIPSSAVFSLDTTYDYTDKFIPQMFMNSIAGQGSMTFKLFNTMNPNDSVRIRFEVEVRDVLSIEEDKQAKSLRIYPQPAAPGRSIFFAGSHFNALNAAKLFSLDGKLVTTLSIKEGRAELPQNLIPAYYLLVLEQNTSLPVQKVILIE